MTIDINGDVIDEITIDGQNVEEVTVDGNTVFKILPIVAKSNLIAWYRFEDGDARDYTAGDSTFGDSENYSGTVNGASYLSNGGVTDFQDGANSGAFDFDGSSDNIVLSNYGLGSHSLSCWFNTDTLNYLDGSDNGTIFGDYDGSSVKYTMIGMESNGVTFRIDDGNNSYVQIGNTSVNTNQWYHAVLTYNSSTGTAKSFLNGIEKNSISYTSGVTFNSQDYYLGRNSQAGEYFNGTIDDARVYNRALSSSEIQNIYNNTKP